MKEVILHIGAHKTGTTTLQKALQNYSDHDTRSASFSQRNHSVPINVIFSKNKYELNNWADMGISHADIDAMCVEFTEVLQKDLTDKKFDRLILSGEGMSLLEPDETAALIKMIKDAGCGVKIVFCSRNPADISASITQQNAISGAQTPTETSVRFINRLGGFLKLVPKENFIVYDYDDAIKGGGIIKFFSNALGIDLPEVASANTSMSRQALSLIYTFNNLAIETVGTPALYEAKQTVVNTIQKIFSVKNGCDKLDRRYFIGFLSPKTQENCDWLRDEFGISYNVDKDLPETSDLNEYLHNSLDGHEDKIARLFNRLGTTYDATQSIAHNISIAFRQMVYNKLSDGQVNTLRDIALKIDQGETLGRGDALALMKIAQSSRPGGRLINAKIKAWSNASKSKK